MRSLFLLLIICFSHTNAKADKYYVFFNNKDGVEFYPYSYFNKKAVERRQKCGIPLVQYSDLPVNPEYLKGITELCDSITVVSRWLNMACVFASQEQKKQIESLWFVKSVVAAQNREKRMASFEGAQDSDFEDLLEYQTERMEGSLFAKKDIKGQGICVAVLDAGFTDADSHDALSHLTVTSAYDFVGKDDNPYHGSTHGTSVLSVIGGLFDGKPMGLATKATYLLARTERHSHEFASEEENWLAAAEWADKNGADVINSSLGYTNHRYFISEMDGNSLVAQAATMAFRKGILVVCSAGNDGDASWKYVGTPADADSVLAIGGIDPYTDLKIDFSSYGPNANGVLKPNLCASGTTFSCSSKQSLEDVDGTSFSSPLVAGFAACLIQLNPTLSQKEIFDLMQTCGSLYPYFDYAHGYGIPLASKALDISTEKQSFFKLTELNGRQIVLAPADSVAQDTCNADDFLGKNFFTKIQTKSGKVVFYKAAKPVMFSTDSWPTLFNGNEVGNAIKPDSEYEVYVHFEGFTQMIKIKWP